jgi:hypothetical protein
MDAGDDDGGGRTCSKADGIPPLACVLLLH